MLSGSCPLLSAHPPALPPAAPCRDGLAFRMRRTRRRPLLTVAALLLGLLGVAGSLPAAAAPGSALQAYADEPQLQAALQRWREQARALHTSRRQRSGDAATAAMADPSSPPAAAFGAPSMAMPMAAAPALPAATAAAAESITNVQTAGVDEGGIVKRAGDHLVILRRGRLFTVALGGDSLQPVAHTEAYGPGIDPRGTWYDELLVAGNRVVVVGYSAARAATEIGLFELSADGRLQHRDTWHLRSGDYYATRNSTSRLIGDQLVFYTPLVFGPWASPSAFPWPTLQSMGAAPSGAGTRLLPATQIYRTDDSFDPRLPLALHTVTRCDLGATRRDSAPACRAQAVLGPAGRVFYVSADAVYVWTHVPGRGPRGDEAEPLSAVFRLPLADAGAREPAAPTALKTAGVPIDALSFLEQDGYLNVLLRANGRGEAFGGEDLQPGGATGAARGMALLRVPLSAFGDGRQAASRAHYRRLPPAPPGPLHNRHVAGWVLWGATGVADAQALRLAGDAPPVTLATGHGVERIESLGTLALLVGRDADALVFSSVRLGRDHRAQLVDRHALPGARSAESRTHGFFYRPLDADQGLLGLPVVDARADPDRLVPAWPAAARRVGQASVVFLGQRDGRFQPLGALQASADAVVADGCKASCVDWYGNARPIFIGERVFALLGYELVEGRLDRGVWRSAITERRRISFAPDVSREGGRWSPFP